MIVSFSFLFLAVLRIELRGVLPPRYTPGPIFLYFILKPGLTKLWRASLSRERDRESWGWPWTRILRFPPPKVLGLQACATTPGSFLSFFASLGIEPRGILSPSYTPSPILFLILKQGLTKLLRLASNLQSSCLSLPSIGITGVHYYGWHWFWFDIENFAPVFF